MKSNINFSSLMEKNSFYLDNFQKSHLMNIDEKKIDSPNVKIKLLDCIQLFSNNFQNTVLLKHVFNEDVLFKSISQEHLNEEFNHNVKLMIDRDHRKPIWDPIIDSGTTWFSWKMLTLDNIEKVVLMHLVLETSACVFFQKANSMFKPSETDYFSLHCYHDEHHSQIGVKLLENLREDEYKKCASIQKKGWEVLITVCNRIAELVFP